MRATGLSTPGIVILGSDQHGDLTSLSLPHGWSACCRPRDDNCLTQVLNRFLREHPELPWYGLICDDNWPITDEWDIKLIAAAMQSGISSCDDGWQAPKRMHSATVWRGDVLHCAGFWNPPITRHFCGDDLWEDIGRRFGLWTCLMNVRVEHRHPRSPSKDRWELDSTNRSQSEWAADDVAKFKAWKAGKEYAALIERFSARGQ